MLQDSGEMSVATIVAAFWETTLVEHTDVRPSTFVACGLNGAPHNGLFLTKGCPPNSVLALLCVVNVSTPKDVAAYLHNTADKQTYIWKPTCKWAGNAQKKPLYFPYTINRTIGIVGAAANSPSDKRATREPLVNACFKTYQLKLETDDEVLVYAVTVVVSMKRIPARKELVVRYVTEADADNYKLAPQDPLPVQ